MRLAGSDDDIRFYTGLPNYPVFTSSSSQLPLEFNYWGSDELINADSRPLDEKRGPHRKLQLIDELFMVLYRLICNVLEKHVAD